MRRVLVLNQFALPRDQGGGTRHIDLFGRLGDDWSVTILAGNRNHSDQETFRTTDKTFRLIRVPRQNRSPQARLVSWVAYCLGAASFGIRGRIDVVYASSPHLLAPLAGLFLARCKRAAFVVEIRDLWPESFIAAGLLRQGSFVHRFLQRLEHFIISRADELVVVTDGWEDHLIHCGADAARITVIPNGAEQSDFALHGFDRDSTRDALRIHGTTAVFAGSHGPKDGIDLIIDSARQNPQTNFLLVGAGPSKAAAEKRVHSEGLHNVQFRDPVPKQELPQLLASCDVGIHSVSPLPVFQLGMSPNKLFDYLAAGLPVVTNAGEPVRRIFEGRECGYVGGSGDLSDGLRFVLRASESQRGEWRQNAAELIATKFSRAVASAKLADVLERSRRDGAYIGRAGFPDPGLNAPNAERARERSSHRGQRSCRLGWLYRSLSWVRKHDH